METERKGFNSGKKKGFRETGLNGSKYLEQRQKQILITKNSLECNVFQKKKKNGRIHIIVIFIIFLIVFPIFSKPIIFI